MKTIELSAAIASAPVQENLKNFAGLDAQNALGLMTPERLAAVAGEKLPVASSNTDGLLSKKYSIESVSLYGKKAVLIHKTRTADYLKFYFRAHVTMEAGFMSGDCSFYVTGTNKNKSQYGICQYKIVAGTFNKAHKLYFKKEDDNSLSIYFVSTTDTFQYFGFVKENLEGESVSNVQLLDELDIASLKEVVKVE